MKVETQGWGSSMVATKYMYQEIKEAKDLLFDELVCLGMLEDSDAERALNCLMKMLAYNYKVDTGEEIRQEPLKTLLNREDL
jgi:hypothetical protein